MDRNQFDEMDYGMQYDITEYKGASNFNANDEATYSLVNDDTISNNEHDHYCLNISNETADI